MKTLLGLVIVDKIKYDLDPKELISELQILYDENYNNMRDRFDNNKNISGFALSERCPKTVFSRCTNNVDFYLFVENKEIVSRINLNAPQLIVSIIVLAIYLIYLVSLMISHFEILNLSISDSYLSLSYIFLFLYILGVQKVIRIRFEFKKMVKDLIFSLTEEKFGKIKFKYEE